MPANRIAELELQLVAANEVSAKLTAANTLLTSQLESAEVRNHKLRKSAGRDARSHREALLVAQSRRSL